MVPPGAGGPAVCRVILRQLPGLDPAAGFLVVLVVVVALVVLLFARGPRPWPGWLRCSWPCCRSSSAWSCRPVPVLVTGKEQGGRVIRGPGGPAWCRAWCRIAGGVAGVLLLAG